MAAMEGEKKMIMLTSSDGDVFEAEEAVARESQTIRHMMENDCADNSSIPLPNVNSKILSWVIEYCNKHVQVQPADPNSSASAAAAALAYYTDELKKWDANFVMADQATLFELILAAKYLDIKGLLVLVCHTFVNEIKAAQIREENQ